MGAAASTQNLHLKQRKEGDAVPEVTIKARVRIAETEAVSSFQWRDISTSDLFKGKRVVVFSIPGGMI
jgi:peroxiredoxin